MEGCLKIIPVGAYYLSYLRVSLSKIKHIFQKILKNQRQTTKAFEVCFEISMQTSNYL